ncbi:MAG: dihydropteroate synthase [Nitrospirae bacterium]|nr:dihydropteroate synthase [Nitrospirota bacterium]MBI3594887.1 dihydropteroate synthase [Nitrospirota bacterium]
MEDANQKQELVCGRFRIQLGLQTRIMGILNVTPDSFSDGGLYFSREKAAERALQMEEEGADFIDIGGESSRPGAASVSLAEELERVIPVLEAVIPRLKIPVSVDTCKTEMARRAIECGAAMINDIRALGEPGMMDLVARQGVAAVLMHMKGTPGTMQDEPEYQSVVQEVLLFLKGRFERAIERGVRPEQIILDPGIGFGKSLSHNLEILRSLDRFRMLNRPVMIGVSHKSFIGKVLERPIEKRLFGSLAAAAWAQWKGIHIVRVHDVRATRDVLKMIRAIQDERYPIA